MRLLGTTIAKRIAAVVAPSVLCCVLTTSAVGQTATETTPRDTHHNDNNGLNLLTQGLKAVLDARAREAAQRKAAAEKQKEQRTATPVPAETQKPAPNATMAPIRTAADAPKKTQVKHKPVRTVKPVATPLQSVPVDTPPTAITPVARPRLVHAPLVAVTPVRVLPPVNSEPPWLLILVGVFGLIAAAGYTARRWLGIGAPVPDVRLFADPGDPAAPAFDEDAPAIALMIGTPPFTTTEIPEGAT